MSLLINDPLSFRPALNPRILLAVLVLTTVLAVIVRAPFMARAALHSDEYLTLYRSLLISEGDIFLSQDPSQKPPLYYFLLAGLFQIFGEHRDIGLTLGFMCSLMLVPATGLLAAYATNSISATVFATLLVALSPFHIAFSNTAFLDPPMLLLAVIGLCCASLGRAGWAGFWCGAAVAIKQQALFFAPLALWFLFASRLPRSLLMLFIAPFLAWCVAIWGWGIAAERRVGSSWSNFVSDFSPNLIPNFIDGQMRSEAAQIEGSLFLNPLQEGWGILLERLSDWGKFIELFFGPLGAVFAIAAFLLVCFYRSWFAAPTRSVSIGVWCVLILVTLTMVRFRIVDRYVLILLPLAAVLISAEFGRWVSQMHRFWTVLLVFLVAGSGLAGIFSIIDNPRVLPTSPNARPRNIGAFTEGVPLTFSTLSWIEGAYHHETELYVHGALFPVARVELSEFRLVRNVLWPLRFLESEDRQRARLLIWQRSDERRLAKLRLELQRGGFTLSAVEPMPAVADQRVAIFKIIKS